MMSNPLQQYITALYLHPSDTKLDDKCMESYSQTEPVLISKINATLQNGIIYPPQMHGIILTDRISPYIRTDWTFPCRVVWCTWEPLFGHTWPWVRLRGGRYTAAAPRGSRWASPADTCAGHSGGPPSGCGSCDPCVARDSCVGTDSRTLLSCWPSWDGNLHVYSSELTI